MRNRKAMAPIRSWPSASAGFSLVEIMVGLIIGMIGVVVIMQVFAVSEGQKRTTTGGGDAQTNGAIALQILQSDVRQSGYGVSAYNLIGCSVLVRPGVTFAMVPVTINPAAIPAGDPGTDTLLVMYGNGNGSSEGDGVMTQPLAAGTAALPDIYAVQTPTSFAVNDRIIAEPRIRPDPCNLALTQVASVGAGSASNVIVTPGTGLAGMTFGALYNLGPAPAILVYAIRGGNLTVCDYMANDCANAANTGNATVWAPIVNNIVSLRAQYGRDTSGAMDGIVDLYDQAVAAPPAVSSVQCGWARVSAVRLALAARSGQYEKDSVTAAAPAWAGSAGAPIDLTADGEWRHYRYKVLQTVVPIRNIAWLGVQSGC
jgi:type IV pilus assembly protein PilW